MRNGPSQQRQRGEQQENGVQPFIEHKKNFLKNDWPASLCESWQRAQGSPRFRVVARRDMALTLSILAINGQRALLPT